MPPWRFPQPAMRKFPGPTTAFPSRRSAAGTAASTPTWRDPPLRQGAEFRDHGGVRPVAGAPGDRVGPGPGMVRPARAAIRFLPRRGRPERRGRGDDRLARSPPHDPSESGGRGGQGRLLRETAGDGYGGAQAGVRRGEEGEDRSSRSARSSGACRASRAAASCTRPGFSAKWGGSSSAAITRSRTGTVRQGRQAGGRGLEGIPGGSAHAAVRPGALFRLVRLPRILRRPGLRLRQPLPRPRALHHRAPRSPPVACAWAGRSPRRTSTTSPVPTTCRPCGSTRKGSW